ncbi:DNA/RNA endonuclease G (NUC1) [Wenyingzhuangia heitensis]|uniref:DNA/RNA endonuclease G (NUC1) n=1 Tax=Wenyingzhuangia heitensis TaxID=1487859 RepID=A0ABX0UA61_9FLAO|nr:DNA/RNA non-specific endonuclease [Wenyingzhuangia heitensis]NIJ45138.1 DNA/RNA endonuclease G (NUC1) [Wenyingzhuangia heitensis]
MINKRIVTFTFLIILTTIVTSCVNCSRSARSKLRNTDENHQIHNTNREKKEVKKQTVNNLPSLFQKLQKSVFMIYGVDSHNEIIQGSGFVIDKSGICITNYHVLKNLNKCKIKLYDGKTYHITEIIQASNQEALDYVIFKINTTFNHSLEISKQNSQIGDDVFAIGSPRGLENTLTKGAISQFRNNKYIQIDATIDHGSSGGPLFNMKGEVIGITTSGIEGSDLNFAIDISKVPIKNIFREKKEKLNITFDNHTSTTGQIIHHSFYTLSYVEKYEQPEWVAYKLIPQYLVKKVERRNRFKIDRAVKTGSATLTDYKGSGYDRGHLAPAGAMSFSSVAMEDSFYMSNMSPQVPGFNRGIWKSLESKVRYWTSSSDSLYVVSGPILKNISKTIGENKVGVPNYYYKVIVKFKNNKTQACAFLLPNKKSNKKLNDYLCTIDEIEELSGIDFNVNFPNSLENELEKKYDFF